MPVLESAVEKRFNELVKPLRTLKIAGPGERGKPDRMVFLCGGRVCFVELKRPGAEPTPLQRHRLQNLRRMGYPAAAFDYAEAAYAWVIDAHKYSRCKTAAAWHGFVWRKAGLE